MMDKPMSVDEYLQGLPPEQRAALEILRKQIMEAAPGVVEGIGWGVPQFKVNGKYVAGFSASKKASDLWSVGRLEQHPQREGARRF